MTWRGSRLWPEWPDIAGSLKRTMPNETQLGKHRPMWLFALICAPLLLSLAECARDLYCDLEMIRSVTMRSEIGQLRSQSVRETGKLEALIEVHADSSQPSREQSWSVLKEQAWLPIFWDSARESVDHQLYAAIVDNSGVIIFHSDPALVGRRLTSEWDDRKEPAAGRDVVRMRAGALADSAALDVNVPITVGGRHIGQYHAGLDAVWFDRVVAEQQRELLWSRSWIVALLVAANLGALIGLLVLAREFSALRDRLTNEVQQRSRQLAQLGMGLAHEIRNPLHALRLNIHTLRRASVRGPLTDQQMSDVMRESDDEIDQLNCLVRDFVQYTVPHAGDLADVDLAREIQATLSLLGEELKRRQIETRTRFDGDGVIVHMDPVRLRQAAQTMLSFAGNRAGQKGTIDIEIGRTSGREGRFAELIITDTGPSLSHADEASLFEPFQSTKYSDSGLSLALVRRVIEEAGGSIERRKHSSAGNCFRILLPLANE
jgi:signal transduction histidine kinase